MSKSEANIFVREEYAKWKESLNPKEEEDEEEKYGVIEKDGNLYLNSKPGEILEIKTKDLPGWARGTIATLGATVTTAVLPDEITSGDSNVLLNGLPIARLSDSTAFGGNIVEGSENIFVNGKTDALIGSMTVNPAITPAVPYSGGPIVANPSN